jgi:osmotically-inducible protein OsmY
MSGHDEVTEAVLRAIRWNASLPDSTTADARDGGVILRGEVDLGCESKAAERAAVSVPAVERVTNEIKVLSRPPIERRDGRSIDRP